MGNFADRLINLAELLGVDDLSEVPARDLSAEFRVAIRTLQELAPQGGGVIYLKPGRWHVGGASIVSIPSNITLQLAPGAVIVPLIPTYGFFVADGLPRPSLEVCGGFECSGGWCLSTAATEATIDDKHRVGKVGWISFPSMVLDTIRPEWWGVNAQGVPRSPGIDLSAMLSAIRAALVRWTWKEIEEAGTSLVVAAPPVPIEISSPVWLNRSLSLPAGTWDFVREDGSSVVVTNEDHGVIFLGRLGSSANIVADRFDSGQFHGSAILDIATGGRFEFLRLRIQAGRDVGRFVSVKHRAGSASVVSFQGCVFDGTADVLVDVSADGSPSSFRPRTVFDDCIWQCRGVDAETALRVSGTYHDVLVRRGSFKGDAAKFIEFSGGELRVDETDFENEGYPARWFETDRTERPPVPERGVDVAVGWQLGAPGVLFLLGCSSSSAQFLSRFRGNSGGQPDACVATVIGLFSRPRLAVPPRTVVQLPSGATGPVGVDLVPRASFPELPSSIFWSTSEGARSVLRILGGRLCGESSPYAQSFVAVDRTGDQEIFDAWLMPTGSRYVLWRTGGGAWRVGGLVYIRSIGYRLSWANPTFI